MIKQKGPTEQLSMLRRVFAREEGKCFWCKLSLVLKRNRIPRRFDKIYATKDHIMPKSKGGPSAIFNIVLSCSKCNNAKGDRLIDPMTNKPISPFGIWLKLGGKTCGV